MTVEILVHLAPIIMQIAVNEATKAAAVVVVVAAVVVAGIEVV